MRLENVEYVISNNVARIEMNRPHVLNALSKGMFRDLKTALAEASRSHDARVVEITGAGNAFSAGLDIREVGGFGSRVAAKRFVYGLVKPFWEELFECKKPIIALVNGPAYGAGAEIALASDIVIASKESTFAFSGGRVGALCCMSGVIGPSLMNGRKLVEMNLTGAALSADEAMIYGLVGYSVPQQELIPTLEKIIKEIMHVSPVSNSSFKRIRRSSVSKRVLETAYKELLRAITSNDFREGSSAFLAKRIPEYYQ
ncbi:MAG TPA: enoyl-CoA hydratase/isomerase family protein [Candidatus Bathyarchaeia archaeon]|jgi:2-(1,2-epoxy-1,2-dihydrophenyl)acetyl-CoA isomerase|nr:enoyl-CoA hydratase/isomerase family protein [Candidatus Bathyarchaeia archaeon]